MSADAEPDENGRVAPEPTYPFVPKSNRRPRPGQFWGIPLDDGRFAAGRVMAVPAFGVTDRTGLVVGLMDWVGSAPPTEEDIAGRPVTIQAQAARQLTCRPSVTTSRRGLIGDRPLAAFDRAVR
jgi:hypothetical protein